MVGGLLAAAVVATAVAVPAVSAVTAVAVAQPAAPFTYALIIEFADQALGPDGANAESYRAGCADVSGANVDDGEAAFGVVN